MKSILVTGAAGRLGSHLRRGLAGRYRMRLTDLWAIDELANGETFATADLASLDDMLRVTQGIDAVVHLGGIPVEAAWGDLLPANVVGTYNVFEAARRNGVKRVLFASSNHVTGFYRREDVVDHRSYPKPDSRYGVAKLLGEQLGSLYANRYGLEVLCMRIGYVNDAPGNERRLAIWISPRDLAHLVEVGLEHPDIRYEIVYGVSANDRSWYDNSNALRLGYRPQDNSERFVAAMALADHPDGGRGETVFQGGSYVDPEIDANLPPIPGRAGGKLM